MTTGVAANSPILQFTLNNGQLAVNGSILTQVGGVNAATYADVGLTTLLPNPIPLNSRGEVSDANGQSQQLFLVPNEVYTFTLFDAKGNQIWQATYVNGIQVTGELVAGSLATVTDQPILASLIRTPAEISAGVTPTNYAYAPYDARRYGADPTGSTDSTAALSHWLTVVQAVTNGTYPSQSFKGGYLPGGVYLVSGALTPITVSKVRIYGDGSDTSRIVVSGGTASFGVLQVGNNLPTSTIVQSIQIEGIGIFRSSGSGSVTLLRVYNTQYSHYRDLTLYDNTKVTGGISLDYRGHENNTFENLWCVNVQPIILGNPSSTLGDGCDHTAFINLEVQSSNDTAALITVVQASTSISNLQFLGNQVWLGGIFGFEWNDTGAGNTLGVGGNLLFENIRREQSSSSSSGETVYIRTGGSSGGSTNDYVTNVVVRNSTFGLLSTLSGGLHFEGVHYATLENVNLSVGGVGITFTARSNEVSDQLVTINTNLDPAATSLTNMEKVFGSDNLIPGTSNTIQQTCVYQYTDSNTQTLRGMRLYEGRKWTGNRQGVTASGGSFIIPGTSTSTAIVIVGVSAGSGSVEGGTFICSATTSVLVSGTTNMSNTVLTNKISVTWDGSHWVVTNQTTSARNITVSVEWM